jgi:hypothetical protein
MPHDHKYALRVVIQRIGSERDGVWRLVAYGGMRPIGFSDFNSDQSILETLQVVVPNLDTAELSVKMSEPGADSIVFTGDMELSYPQLSALGLG